MANTTITERIRTALEAKGLKKGDFYRYAGIKSQNLKNWERRENSVPAADTAIKMAEFLRVSVKWLVLGEEDAELASDEIELINSYKLLDPKDKTEIMGIIALKLENAKKTATLSNSEIG